MDKYTIIIMRGNEPKLNYKTFDEMLKKSKQLCRDKIYHVIRDNEFNVSVKMAEYYR